MPFRSIAPLLKLAAAVLAALLLVDAVLFRSGLYYRWLDPDSTAGSVKRTLLTIRYEYDPARRNVLVLGNSRIGMGFSALLADAASGREDLHFVDGSVAGSTPRAWNYLLRAIDPDADRFAAIAMMVDYDVAAMPLDMRNYADTAYLVPLLRVADLRDYSDSFSDLDQRARARRAILLPLQALHEDVARLIAHPFRRRHAVRSTRRNAPQAILHYGGREGRLPDFVLDASGLPLDWGDDPTLRRQLEPYFHDLQSSSSPEMQAANAAYLREWLGRIASRYAAHGVPLFVFVVPRGPWHGERAAVPEPTGPVAELAARGDVVPLPGDAFVALERPQFFFDTAHMNKDGRERFSRLLARAIAERMP
jgi:hypothetical protein